ncbi:MAG: molybdenum cofactor guanylyltransferase [Candidatus Dormibacteraceae bacterium]
MAATLLVLAGGESRRMGRPKALLPAGDGTLLEWVLDALSPQFEEVLVSANHPDQVAPGMTPRIVGDLHPGAGPLAGIEAGLAACRHDVMVVVACDMPRVTAPLVRLLVTASRSNDAAMPRLDGVAEPACAAYRRSAARVISASLDDGRLRAGGVLGALRVRYLDELELEAAGVDRGALRSLNSPEDYARFRAEHRPRGGAA